MANKAFEIQNSTLRIGGVDLEAGTTGVVIPGVTQATNYFVEEINERDGSNPDIFGNDPDAITVIDNAEYLYRSNDETPSASYSAAGYSVQELDDGEIDEIYVEVDGNFLDSDRTLALASNMWATTASNPYTNFNPNDWTQIPYRPKIRAGEVENIGGGIGGSNTITIPAQSGTTYKGLQVSYGTFHSHGNTNIKSTTKVVIHKPGTTDISIANKASSDFFQVSGLTNSDVLAMFVLVSDINGPKTESDIQAFAEAVIDNIILYNGEEGEYNTVSNMKDAFYANTAFLASSAGGTDANFKFYQNIVPTTNGATTELESGSGAEFDIVITNEGVYAAGIISTVTVNQRIENDGGNSIHTTTSGAENIPIGSTMSYGGTTYTVTNILIPDPAHGSGIEIQVSPNIFLFPSADTYTFQTFLGPNSGGGSGYKNGHKVKILGTSLGGVTPDNDAIVEVYTTDGAVTNFNITGTPANNGSVWAGYSRRTGTNYNLGSGLNVTGVYYYVNNITVNNYGTNYVLGDVITLLGENIVGGTTPENNITITVGSVGVSGEITNITVSGTAPQIWPTIGIENTDQYSGGSVNNTGNFIDSSYEYNIDYNDGETVEGATSTFGNGSTYSFVYENGIFGLFVRGNSSSRIGTNGDGPGPSSIVESGNIYGPNIPERTINNAINHINIVENNPYTGQAITFTRDNYGDEVDEISDGLHIARGNTGGLYNPLLESEYTVTTPSGSLWNKDGWEDLADVRERNYVPLENAIDGNYWDLVGSKFVMKDETTGKYWAIEFLSWVNDFDIDPGGGFSYTRRELNLNKLQEGVYFPDGTVLKSAAGVGRVKLTSPGDRRIEEVYGYKEVSVAAGSGNSAEWWNKNDLPGGSDNFRGAIIDYHAYTGDSTIIGTIHIVDDDSEEHISHIEAQSGSTDGENDDLWYVTSEGRIRYRRLDGESATLKVQWSAKVFYGSELYD